jgi:hypothetical protein
MCECESVHCICVFRTPLCVCDYASDDTLLERAWSEGVGEVEARRSLLRGRAVPRASLTERGPGASVADSPLYVRAGKVCDRERCPPRDLSFTP